MSRSSKFLLIVVVVVFSLACNLFTQPFEDVQESISTVQAIATSIPIETIQSFATAMPVDTMQALGDPYNPQGAPLSEWNGIPIMPEASAGGEFGGTLYSYKVDALLKEIVEYYEKHMIDLGWENPIGVIEQSEMTIIAFTKDTQSLTITLSLYEEYVLVMLILG